MGNPVEPNLAKRGVRSPLHTSEIALRRPHIPRAARYSRPLPLALPFLDGFLADQG